MHNIYEYLTITAAAVSIVSALITVLYFYREKRKKSIYLQNIAKVIHQVAHETRDLNIGLGEYANDPVKFMRILQDKVSCLLPDIENAINIINKHKCSVSVKLLYSDEEDGKTNIGVFDNYPSVITFARTKSLSQRRDTLSLKFGIDDTTEYHAIVNGSEYFFSNDLKALYQKGEYINRHVTHKEEFSYRSILVVPIRIKKQMIIGFLCVDSKLPNSINLDVCLSVIQAFAETLSIIFSRLYNVSLESSDDRLNFKPIITEGS